MWTRFENTTKTRTNTAGGRAEQSTKAKVGAPTFKWFPRRLVIGLSTLPFTNHSSFPAICRSLLITIWSCEDRKSTRLNSSHVAISYAVFCLTKKKQYNYIHILCD